MQGLDMLSDYDYIAIFDADFKPEPDFLVSVSICGCCSLCAQAPCDSLMLVCSACMQSAASTAAGSYILRALKFSPSHRFQQELLPDFDWHAVPLLLYADGDGALLDRQPGGRLCASPT